MQEFLSPTGKSIFAETEDATNSTGTQSDSESDRDPEMIPIAESTKHSGVESAGLSNARERARKLATTRLRIASALNRQFKMTIFDWQDCSGKTCKSDAPGSVSLVLGPAGKNSDHLDEVLSDLDKVLRSAQISRLIIKPVKTGDASKYHIVASSQPPEPLELLAPITNSVLELQTELRKSTDPAPMSPVDAFIASVCKKTEQPLMSNLLIAFERKRMVLEHTDSGNSQVSKESAEFHFDQALIRLLTGQLIDVQLKALASINTQSAKDDGLGCQSSNSVHLIHCLKLLSEHSSLSTKEATQAASELLQNLPDNLYRMQALYELAVRAKCATVPGLNNSDSEKDTLHSVTVIMLLAAIATCSPLFAFLTFKRLRKTSNELAESQELSAVQYGFKRMVAVVLTLIFSLLLVVGFEYAVGFDSTLDTAMLALYHPTERILCDLVASSLFNLPVFLVYFLWCIPRGISFSEGFGMRLSTLRYSFKQLCVTGLFAYLAVSAVTASTMILMVYFHHPDSTSDTSSNIATTMSPIAAALMFFVESIFGPFLEELCFRGVLYRGLRASWGIVPSLIVSSLWFAVLHNEFAPWLLFHKFAVGAVNALLYEKTRSLVPSVIAHCLNNIFLDIT